MKFATSCKLYATSEGVATHSWRTTGSGCQCAVYIYIALLVASFISLTWNQYWKLSISLLTNECGPAMQGIAPQTTWQPVYLPSRHARHRAARHGSSCLTYHYNYDWNITLCIPNYLWWHNCIVTLENVFTTVYCTF